MTLGIFVIAFLVTLWLFTRGAARQPATLTKYETPSQVGGWSAYIEPPDKSWITFIRDDGFCLHYPKRDKTTGGVVE